MEYARFESSSIMLSSGGGILGSGVFLLVWSSWRSAETASVFGSGDS